MNGQDATETTTSTARRGCLVEGCACKDARILSPRRASYVANLAKSRGETAHRVIPADPSWSIPLLADRELAVELRAVMATDVDATA